LEHSYKLPKLKPILEEKPDISSQEYLETLKKYFDEAVRVTGDFEQIFYTGLFDHIVLSEERGGLYEIDELIKLLSLPSIGVEELSDIIGYIYEDLIPAEERHQMGQFYTPRPIAELIAKWCIRSPNDVILGPGCGSGTFEAEAYWRLAELKTGGKRGIPLGKDVHKSILRQIYALDINPFPAQLTAMNLAMKNVRAPTTEANIITADFFAVMPGQTFIASYPVITPSGPKPKEIFFPEELFDVVMGNPPYIRWDEVPDSTLSYIIEKYSNLLGGYKILKRGITGGAKPGMYIPWIMHSATFLKDNGRLGMIISDAWLQTDYGKGFLRYLLDTFKIHSIIDLGYKVFNVPLIGTCIVLLERKTMEDLSNYNFTFIYLSGEMDIDDLLDMIKGKIPTYKPKQAYRHN